MNPLYLPCSDERQLRMYTVVANGACHCRTELVAALGKAYAAAGERLDNPGVAKPLVAGWTGSEDWQWMGDRLLDMEPPVGSFSNLPKHILKRQYMHTAWNTAALWVTAAQTPA